MNQKAPYSVYQFEAVFIQEYVFGGGKIKTMVGASELIEAITHPLLDEAIEKLGLRSKEIESLPQKGELNLSEAEVVFPRRAGGVFMMISQNQEKMAAFAQLWPILVNQFAPGLRFSAAMDTDNTLAEATKKVRHQLNHQKNQPQTFLPESTPLTVRYQKTGLAQVEAPKRNKKTGADWTTKAKLSHSFKSLADKHLANNQFQDNTFTFPHALNHEPESTKGYWRENFPFKSTDAGNHSVAIIHTDGNGLGLYVQKVFAALNQLTPAEYVRGYAQFSQGLQAATQKAAQSATSWLIEQYRPETNPYKAEIKDEEVLPLPMRPLILGGDDLTCIVRADYALGFVQAFTKAFERETAEFLARLSTLNNALPDKLTCTTGMIFIRSNQPFYLAYQLAEALCSEAKKVGQNSINKSSTNTPIPPSLIYFLHTTNTLFDTLDVQIKQELQTTNNQYLTLCPYAFQPKQGRPTLQQLYELKTYFDKARDDKLKPSAIRNYAGHLHQDPHYAQVFWDRWKKRMTDDGAKTRKSWDAFEDLWQQMIDEHPAPNHMPVADLVTLFSLDIQAPEASSNRETNG